MLCAKCGGEFPEEELALVVGDAVSGRLCGDCLAYVSKSPDDLEEEEAEAIADNLDEIKAGGN